MKRSAITEFFLDYFEKNQIEAEWISGKIGIKKEKLLKGYKKPLTADEFLQLCAFLEIRPEEIKEVIKDSLEHGKSSEKN